jgi:hypothetical protein
MPPHDGSTAIGVVSSAAATIAVLGDPRFLFRLIFCAD